jgi:transcriptional regulator with XRE-family HTH domain
MLEISPSYISEIESGKKEPTLDLIRRYAEVFHTSPASLLFFAEDLDKDRKSKNFKALFRAKTLQFLQNIENAGRENLPHRA